MSPMILVFNLSEEKLARLRFVCMRLRVQVKPVEKADWGQPMGVLGGLAPRSSGPAPEETFAEEMLVMVNFTQSLANRLLAALKQARLPMGLKAVLTPTNVHWTPVQLHRELSAERAAMAQGREAEHHA